MIKLHVWSFLTWSAFTSWPTCFSSRSGHVDLSNVRYHDKCSSEITFITGLCLFYSFSSKNNFHAKYLETHTHQFPLWIISYLFHIYREAPCLTCISSNHSIKKITINMAYLLGMLPRGNSACVSWIRTFWKSTNLEWSMSSWNLCLFWQTGLRQTFGWMKQKEILLNIIQ